MLSRLTHAVTRRLRTHGIELVECGPRLLVLTFSPSADERVASFLDERFGVGAWLVWDLAELDDAAKAGARVGGAHQVAG